MHAVTVNPDRTPDDLHLVTLPDLVPGPGEVLIDVAAAGVNRADLLQRAGLYPPPPGAPSGLGLEISGVVAGGGPGALVPDGGPWHLGQRVAALLVGGGYASQVTVPTEQVLPVPDMLDLVDAAALPEAVCTAWSALVELGRLSAGETVLIQGGSGGVGSVAVQLAAALGARVLATARGPERAARCEALGASVGLDYRRDDFTLQVQGASLARGVDLVLDVLGAGGLTAHLEVLATGGRLVVIGLQRGRRAELDLGVLLTKRASIHGTTLRARPPHEKAALVAAVREHAWPMLDDGRLRPVVHARLPLGQAADAHRMLGSGSVFGKVLLVT